VSSLPEGYANIPLDILPAWGGQVSAGRIRRQVEDFQVSTDTLAKKLGFPRVTIGWENRSERDEKINEVVEEDFVRRHKLEFAIYDFALQQYKEIEGS